MDVILEVDRRMILRDYLFKEVLKNVLNIKYSYII